MCLCIVAVLLGLPSVFGNEVQWIKRSVPFIVCFRDQDWLVAPSILIGYGIQGAKYPFSSSDFPSIPDQFTLMPACCPSYVSSTTQKVQKPWSDIAGAAYHFRPALSFTTSFVGTSYKTVNCHIAALLREGTNKHTTSEPCEVFASASEIKPAVA